MRHAWILTTACLVVASQMTSLAPACAAAENFVVEGVADPQQTFRTARARTEEELQALVRQQASFDAVAHLSSYTRGLVYLMEAQGGGQFAIRLGPPEFQSLAGLTPVHKEFKLLKSGLLLARVAYAGADVQYLHLYNNLLKLPVYRVTAEYRNPEQPLSKPAMHWLAANECYGQALSLHLSAVLSGQSPTLVRARLFPVQVIAAELLPAPATPTPVAPPATPSASSAAPAAGQAPASAGPPAETAGPAPVQTARPPASAAPPPASAAPAPLGTGQVAPPPGTAAGHANAGAMQVKSGASPPAAPPFDSRTVVYRLQMDVRVVIEEVKFDNGPAAPAGTAGTASPATTAASAAAPPPAPSETPGSSSAAPATALPEPATNPAAPSTATSAPSTSSTAAPAPGS